MITLDGKKYVVIENMGYIHDRGKYGKVINFNGEERIALKFGKSWKLATPKFGMPSQATGQKISQTPR